MLGRRSNALIPDLTYMLKLNEGTKQMSAINTVNTVDQTLAAYANDNKSNTLTNDYNNNVSTTLGNALNPRKSLADIAGISFPSVPTIYVNDNK